MKRKNLYSWVLILAVAILVSAAIIIPPALAYSGQKAYAENAAVESADNANPEAAVEAFYSRYLLEIGDPASGSTTNPLASRSYREDPYLAPGFVRRVDEILDEMDPRGGYDPFLCAQDLPGEFYQTGTFYHGGGASLVLRSNFPNHFLVIDLQQGEAGWLISNISCGATPESAARAFYTWYLAYIGDRESEEMRNPLVDRAYRESPYLSAGFIQDLDDLIAGGIPADPILMAQDIPQDFSVDPGPETGTAIVHLQFGDRAVNHIRVSMIEENGAWKIDGIEKAN